MVKKDPTRYRAGGYAGTSGLQGTYRLARELSSQVQFGEAQQRINAEARQNRENANKLEAIISDRPDTPIGMIVSHDMIAALHSRFPQLQGQDIAGMSVGRVLQLAQNVVTGNERQVPTPQQNVERTGITNEVAAVEKQLKERDAEFLKGLPAW